MGTFGYVPAMKVAELLGLHIASVYRLGKVGKLKIARIGRAWYISLDSVEAYLKAAGPEAFQPLIAQVQKMRNEGRRSGAPTVPKSGAP